MSSIYPQGLLTSARLRTVLPGLTLAFVLSCSSLAVAQTFYADPPKGFDPVAASEADRARYGFPPAPDRGETAAYASWQRMVTTKQTRLRDAGVTVTNYQHKTALNVDEQSAVFANANAATSSNWSGYVATAANNTFASSGDYVYAQWVVPAVGVENCADAPIATSDWVGIDGYGSDDVLQAGIKVTACGTSYAAWYEWYTGGCTTSSATQPCYEVNFNLPINPGDLIDTEVWYTTAADNGHAFILNVTTGQAVSVSFNQPAGSAGSGFKASSVEWIVERPEFNNALVNLLNYGSVVVNEAQAHGTTGYFYPSSSPAGSTLYNVTMTCGPWKPSTACPTTSNLSYANLYGTWTLWFYDEGPAL